MNRLGMWMWPYSVRQDGAEKVIAYCKRARVTDLYFLSKGLEGETAFRGPYAPCICERDLLQELLDEAHRAGIRVHAWFTSACDEHYKQQHPESGRCHLSRGRDRELISLTDEGYMTYLEQIIRDVCRRYDIDGLHLDYIRYNHMLYGWDEADLRRYEAAGADAARLKGLMEEAYGGEERKEDMLLDLYRGGDKNLRAFARVRRQDVYRFATRMCHAARQERADIALSAALMPEGAYPDAAYADLHYGQSYEDAAGLYDHVLPMAYSEAYGKDAAWVRDVAGWTLGFGVETVMGLHAYEEGTAETLKADAEALADTAVQGICLFRLGACALAFEEQGCLSLYNALPEDIVKVRVCSEAGEQEYDLMISAGEEKQLPVQGDPVCVGAYTAAGEISVYLTRGV